MNDRDARQKDIYRRIGVEGATMVRLPDGKGGFYDLRCIKWDNRPYAVVFDQGYAPKGWINNPEFPMEEDGIKIVYREFDKTDQHQYRFISEHTDI